MKRNYTAFTMAEVLITLGIIGIVAAMTLPLLMSKYQDYVFKIKWKTLFSKISNAYISARDELALSDSDEMFESKQQMLDILELIRKNLNIQTSYYKAECSDGADCSAGGGSTDLYKTLYGTKMNPYSFGSYNEDHKIWYSIDNATVYFRPNEYYNMFVIYIFVDVNGTGKPPNILGKDFFALVITPKGSCPIGGNCGYRPEYFKNSCTSSKEIYATSQNGMHDGSPISGIGCSAEKLIN